MLSLSTMASDQYKSHDPSYAGQNQWSHMQGYNAAANLHNAPPMNDYQSYDYTPPPPTSMPMDMPYHMGRPANYPPQQHHQLPPLAIQPMGQPIWPSMLTGGASQPPPNYQTPILPAVPIQTPVSAISTTSDATPTSATKSSSSRRKLTDDERRKMCIEAATNPNMKQTQIGLKFGVERSTVSKILRQKDKYMNSAPAEGSSSPPKKLKTKFPDIERALVNWARNEDRKGVTITDDKLKKQALFFSSTFGNSDNHSNLTSDAWLARFKQKHLLGTSKKSKSGSRDFSEVTVADSSTTSYADGHLDHSPASSASGLVSPTLSLEEDDLQRDVKNGNDDFFDFGDRHVGHSMALGEVLSPDLESGGAILSPLSPETQRPSSVTVNSADLDGSPAYASAYNRQRSQTFPHFHPEETAGSRPNSSGRHTPLPVRSVTASVAPQDLHVNPREMMKRSESVPNIRDASAIYMSSMRPPPLPKSERNSPVSPGSPTPEEARRALRILQSFFQAQPPDMSLDMDDWTSIGNMMRKLRLPRNADEDMPVGMVPLDILDDPRPMKKRTILGIST